MNEEQINTFLAIVRCGSFSGAAEELYMTQPAVTHRIKTLENELGIPLFFRETPRTLLTPAGQAFVKEARTLKAAFRRAYSSMLPYSKEQTVKVGFPPLMMLGECKAFFSVMKFAENDDRINLQSVLLDDPTQNPRRLTDGEVDLLFSDIDLNKYAATQFEKQPLFRSGLYVCLHKDHPLAQHTCLTQEDLQGQTLLRYHDGTLFSLTIRQLLQEMQLRPSAQEYPTFMQALAHLAPEKGVILTNVQLFSSPDHVYLPLKTSLSRRIGIVWLKNRCTPALRLLIQYICELPPDIWRN